MFTLLCWVCFLIAAVILLIYSITLVCEMMDFETDCCSPIDVVQSLNKKIKPLFISEFVAFLCSIPNIANRGWPMTILNSPVTAIMAYLIFRKRPIFSPLTIVRKLEIYRGYMLIIVAISGISVIYSLIFAIIEACGVATSKLHQ